MYKKVMKYFEKHPIYNSTVHVVAGVGIGILITYPYVGAHPVRWGLSLLTLGVLGHLMPIWMKK
ncbi:hypothetical protein HYS03_02240 [Candidatus Woesebacteria bacterium]|nr:hypothetical protein [Candidatus Woesebacteria bacterium]QQG47711.1 MAG: hypothetical protein HY044_01315 [Candidatus Woesebacteria bacterium]